MNYKSFLIKYAEIGVKGKNRYLFEDALVKQINMRLKRMDGRLPCLEGIGPDLRGGQREASTMMKRWIP